MAKRRSKKSKSKFRSLIIILLAIVYGVWISEMDSTLSFDNTDTTFQEVDSNLEIQYLDVGQADAILIENSGEFLLIDAGNNEDGKLIVQYCQEMGITKLKYLVGTHPHEDHIGGMDDVIEVFEIGTIYIPDVITTTKTFTDVLDAIEAKNMTYTVPKIGEKFSVGDANIRVIYTGTDSKDLNDASIVLKLTFGTNTFLFTGDATEDVEEVILDEDIQADVLKVAHHGSSYSTSDKFLETVNPKYAILSVGSGNSYGHPHDEVLNKLLKKNIMIHRTDLEGTIILTSDGKNISIQSHKTNTNG